ncbi:MAG: S9 family peptidase, partial [Pseudomonadota bacterium]
MRSSTIAAAAFATLLGSGVAPLAHAQDGYQTPPADIAAIVTRAPAPRVSLSPDKATMLLMEREALPPVSELAKPMEKLAGMRLDANINDRHGPRAFVGLTLQDVATGKRRAVALPEDADIGDIVWSLDGSKIAFTNTRRDAMDLHVLDVASGEVATLMAGGVNCIFQNPTWMADGSLLVMTIPEGRGPKPLRSLTPTGPAIQDASGGQDAQTRTFQDLLKDPHDEAMFQWLATSQPIIMDADGSNKRMVGSPRIYTRLSRSTDSQYLLMEWLSEPFSYQVPWYRFPRTSAVFTINGEFVATIAEQPLADALPVQGVVTGPRNIQWHPTEDALLMWAEAQDGGDPRTETDNRDNMMALAAPFDGDAAVIARLEDRASGALGLEGSDDLLVYEYDRDTRELRETLIDVTGGAAPREISVRNVQDAYNDPGNLVRTITDRGRSVVRVVDGKALLTGMGATPEGLRPFLRRFDLATLETEEIWRNAGEQLESVIDVLSDDGSEFLTFYESPTNPGNFRVHSDGEARFV